MASHGARIRSTGRRERGRSTTRVAAELEAGYTDPEACDRLVELLYPELRRLARGQLRRLRPGDRGVADYRFFAGGVTSSP